MSEERPSLPVSYSQVSLAVMTHGREANLLGTVHGGEIMKLVDSTAGAVANRHSGGAAVTAFMDEMAFLEPVQVGDIVRTLGQVNWVGVSSMEIGVRVEAQPWGSAADDPVHVASAYVVFVAIDEERRPRLVPDLTRQTPEEERRHREAVIRRSHRLARRAEIESGRAGS